MGVKKVDPTNNFGFLSNGELKLHKGADKTPAIEVAFMEHLGNIFGKLVYPDGTNYPFGTLFRLNKDGIHLYYDVTEKSPIALMKGGMIKILNE